jgi:hypothetical protein
MKLRAKDSFNTSGIGTVHAGSEFEVHDALGQELVDKGHAVIVEATTPTAAGAAAKEPAAAKAPAAPKAPLSKADLPPLNKMAETPANKSKPGPKPKDE